MDPYISDTVQVSAQYHEGLSRVLKLENFVSSRDFLDYARTTSQKEGRTLGG